MIAPLHVHSEFSMLDGWSTAAEIAARCKQIGCSCCALTDHGVVAGHLQFSKELTNVGVKPIFGCEFYQGSKASGFKGQERDQSHLIALAMTDQGLRNLWALNSSAATENHFRYVSRVFREDILKYKEGIVFTSACALGAVPKGLMRDDYEDLNWYLDHIGDNFFIELSTYPGDREFNDRDLDGTPISTRIINEALVAIGLERGVEFVYGDDGHYAFPEQFEQHDIYLARQTGDSIFTPVEERSMYHPPDALCIKDEAMVRKNLSYLPQNVVDNAIDNTMWIGKHADAQLPEVRRHLPVFIPGDSPWVANEKGVVHDDQELFLKLVMDGVYQRYGETPGEDVLERVTYECETLIRDGIHHYFLMGWDQISFCDHMGISRGPGRGSSAGCIVAYCLGITDVDPLHYGLIFERFWNSGRTDGFPDIDSDFARSSRQDVIDYLKERWGKEMVCPIGTVGRMKPKKVCENMQKVFGITNEELSEIKRIVGETKDIEIHGVDQIGWSREMEPGKVIYVEEEVGDKIDEWIEADPKRKELRQEYIEMCRQACSRVHLYGIHPSGIVISDVVLNNELPAALRGSGSDRKAATQFPMDDVDKRFFVKLDVLGLRTLDTLDHWAALMKDEGIDIHWSGLDKQRHPDEMWDLLQNGYAAGIFQVESGYPKQLCERMNARSVEDLAVIVALNRPGPIGDGIPDRYIARRSGDEEVTYETDRLRELLHPWLAPTYGLFVYQEQVINYFNSLGYTLHESDAVRKILGKKRPEQLAALHDGSGDWEGRGYIAMAHAVGVPEKPAQRVWDGLERFASYSFNKSHAVAYGIVGFRTLFAKYYGPAQFYAACLRTAENEKRKEMLPLYINEARRMNLEVYPPDIQVSQGMATVKDGMKIYFGFGDVKNVGASGDYMARLRDRFDYSTPEIFYEQFDELNRAYLKQKKDRIKLLAQGEKVDFDVPDKSPKQLLGANKIESIYKAGAWDSLIPTDLPMSERQSLEMELLEVILTDYSKEAFEANWSEVQDHVGDWDEINVSWADKVNSDDPEDAFIYKVPGVITGIEQKVGKASGKKYGLITISFDSHELSFVAHNAAWKSHRFLWEMRTPGIFTIKHTPPNEFSPVYSYQFLNGHKLSP